MKKALIVANLAGFASFLIHDMELLIEKGYSITYAANAKKLEWQDTKEKIDKLGVSFVQIDFDSTKPLAKTNIKAYRQLKKLLDKEKFELIHCHTPIAGIYARIAAIDYRKKGSKVIYTSHGFAFTSNSSWKTWLLFYNIEKACSRLCDAIITINREDFDNAKKMHCRNVYQISGVGVDVHKYSDVCINRDEYRRKLGIPENKIMILAVGELSVRKNHQIIVKALSKIKNKEDYSFVICGNGIDGGTGKKLAEMAEELQVDLRLLGFRRDIPEIIASSDIGVIPSIREGLGLSGIQSLAGGVPLIGSKVQGIKDYIVDGKNGYLCDAFDENDFSEKILKLSNAEVREKMKSECLLVAKKFDKSISFDQMRKIYDELL